MNQLIGIIYRIMSTCWLLFMCLVTIVITRLHDVVYSGEYGEFTFLEGYEWYHIVFRVFVVIMIMIAGEHFLHYIFYGDDDAG